MKFMKLGSKPDSFQAEGDSVRYVATELATDLVVNVGDVKFYLHKFPLLSKSVRLQKLVAATIDETTDEIQIGDIPGGPATFEICAKFCYGMTVTLNAYNVVAVRCAAEFLEMYETSEKGNLIYKIEVFLNSSIFRSWKDSIIVLQTTKSLHPWSDELKIVGRCLDSIAAKASIDTTRVDWSYTYNNRKKLESEKETESQWNGVRKQQSVPRDWWVEDLCELQIEPYKRVIASIKAKSLISSDLIGEALHAYAVRRIPGFGKGVIQSNDVRKHRTLMETILRLLPSEKGSVSCGFLLRLLRAAILLEIGELERSDLVGRIGMQLDEAAVPDLLFRAPPGETAMYDVDTVERLILKFVTYTREEMSKLTEFEEVKSSPRSGSGPAARVAKLVDGYLSETARDPNLSALKFIGLANLVSGFPRPTHDGLYRAIDMYLKEHPEIGKSDRKKMCKLMDCNKLSAEACMHAVQNERLPLRMVVQVLFFEQMRTSTISSSTGSSAPSLPGSIGSLLPGGSHGSLRSISATTNTEDDWDGVPSAEELKALKGHLAALRLGGAAAGNRSENGSGRGAPDKSKVKGLLNSKIFSRLFSGKDRQSGELSSSDTSDSPGSVNNGETKSTPSRSRRQSVS